VRDDFIETTALFFESEADRELAKTGVQVKALKLPIVINKREIKHFHPELRNNNITIMDSVLGDTYVLAEPFPKIKALVYNVGVGINAN
jgi:hypothetical protein